MSALNDSSSQAHVLLHMTISDRSILAFFKCYIAKHLCSPRYVLPTRVPIFIEHWGGNNLQFYPNFALFSTLGGDELRPRFFSGEQIN